MSDSKPPLDAGAAGWMPLRLAVIAPLAGTNPDRPPAPLRVVSGRIAETMAAVSPRLSLRLTGPEAGAAPRDLDLTFGSLRDFEPDSLLAHVPLLADLKKERDGDPARAGEREAVLRKWLDAILHHPAFLELEAAWRGLEFLAKRGGAGEGEVTPLILEALVAASSEDYLPRFREQLFDPDYEDRSETPLAAVLLDRTFDHLPSSIEQLASLAGLANVLQIAVIGGAGPAFFGLKNLAHLPALPDLATRSQGGAYGAWNVFQRENHARWISLTVNRLLLRGPHGEGEAPAADRFRYAETVDPAHPEWLCWGNACWAAGVSLALSYAEHGHCAAADGLSGTGGHHHLPVRLVPGGMGKTASVTTEVVLPDQKAWDLCRAGFTPLVGMANGDSAYFPFLGNVYRSRPGSVTVDQSLLYQLYAGQLGHVVLKLAPRLRGLGPEEAVRQLEQGIFAHLSPFVGDAPGQRVKVAAASAPDGAVVASIQVSPTFKIQDKPVELELQLPLG